MSKVFKNNPQQAKLILEELEERRLFSGGIEGLIASDLDSEAQAIYADADKAKTANANNETSASVAEQQSQEIVFVDAGVDNYQQLVDDIRNNTDSSRNIEVVVLDRDKDGIEEISEFLSHRENLDAIHIISHGSDGSVELGNTSLNADTLEQNNLKIALWANNFADTGDILIYGCSLAETEAGQSLINDLSALTLTDVAASTDLTGAASQGGDWALEFSVGQVESNIAVSAELQQEYQGTFATYTVTSLADSGAGSLREAVTLANTSGGADIIEFGVAGTINLSSALPTIDEELAIDGSTAPGYSGDPVVNIDGSGVTANGLHFTSGADNSTVNALMITNFTGNGIQIDNGADGITITGNWIGTTGTGTTGDGNSNNGINVQGANTVIGGTGANDGNVITNNGNEGINLTGTGATGTLIQGNIIGLDPDGSTGSGNGDVGIALLTGSDNTIIGGTTEEARNIISNNFEGIEINSDNNTVQGNYIGTDITGTLDRGNDSSDGIEIQNNATGNLIGGTEEGAGNLLAFNNNDGIEINSGSGNVVLGNEIHSNGDQEIDLAAGANGDQAAPVLTSAQTTSAEITISGSLSSTANSYFRIEFFGSNQTYLGFVNVATDGSGNATFDTTLSASVTSGTLITSTATKSDASYSTFTDTSAFASTVVSGNAGTAIWRDASTTPQTSDWDGSAFGSTTATAPAGDYRIMQGAEAPTRDEIIIIGVDGSDEINGEIWNGSSWSVLPSVTLGSPLGTVGQNYWWSMDVAYEQQSGDALMVWTDGANIEYATWDGSSWSGVNTISYSGATPQQLQLAASPNSDEMVLVVSDSNSEDFALVWNGSSWGNEQILEQVAGDDRTDIYVTYEQQSGAAMVVYGKTNIDAYYRIWDGTSWGAEGSVSQAVGASGNLRWSTLAADPNSDQIALGITTYNGETWLNVWDGSSWGTSELATTTSTGTNHPAVAVAFESTSGDLLAAYGESGSSDVKFKTWTAGGGWSTEQVGPNIGGTPNSLMLAADPISDQIMLTAQDSNSDVNYVLWDGSSWGTPTELGTSTTETKNQPFLFLWDQAPGNFAPTFIDGAVGNWNFDEGSGDSATESAIGISAGTLGSTTGTDANDPTWTTGKFGQALHFDGVNDYVEIADAPGLDISGPEFSASLWMNPDSGPNQEDMLFMKGDRQGNINYYLSWKDSGEMTWAFKDSAGWHYQDMAVTMPTTGQWNHIGITFDRPTVSLYVNGTKYVFDDVATGGSMDRDLTANNEVMWIGAGRDAGALVGVNQWSGPFTGSIDELALFDRALTDADMEAIRTGTPPVVTASAFSIDENSANNTVVGNVVATDPDIGDTLSYAITAGNTGGAFSIDANGQIKVANSAALDFETNPVFNLTIEATDDGTPAKSDTTSVSISLNDANDAPVATADTVATNQDTAVLIDVLANDSDPETDPLTTRVITGPTNGTLVPNSVALVNETNLTNNAADTERDAVWSPDGTQIAFYSDRDGNNEIYVMDADGSNVVRLTNDAGSDNRPSWSPDGTQIVFQSTRGGNNDIYVIDADGTNETRLTNHAAVDGWPEWSPDGTQIAFMSGRDGNNEIYVMDADGSNQTRITTNAANDKTPSWSPDGTQLAFVRADDIWVMDADGTNLIQLTNSDIDGNPSWSPDGTRIAFHSDRDGNYEIYVMDAADGLNLTRLTNNGGIEGNPEWSPDGSQILFHTNRDAGNYEIYVADISSDGTYTYTPDAGFSGVDSFTYVANDGTSDSAVTTVTITVDPVDTPAVITGDVSFTGNEGDAVAGDLNATDVDGLTDGTYFSVTTPAANGTAAIDATTGAWTFTPTDPNWFGSDSFTVTVTDDLGGTTTQLVSITLASINDAPVMTAWFNDAWDTRKGLTINAASVAGDVTDFPVLITLNVDAELAAQALANGDDILFTAADGVTQLAHEIEFFDETTGELRVWVKTDLSASVDTSIYMYFGNAASGNQENIPGVWDNYVGVYHLGESPTGAPGEIIDSSGSGNHGNTEGAMDAADSVSTTIGQGLAFDGTNDKIRIPNSASLDGISDEATFSLWINYVDAADGQHQIVMTSEDRFSATDGYEWASNGAGDHFFYPDAMTPDGNYNLGDNPFTNDAWHHLAATMDFATKEVKIYVDGTPMVFTSEGVPGNWTTTTTSTADLLWGGNPDRAERFFLGMMDEIRIADVARSQEWIQTEVNNQSAPGSFFSLGTTEDREDKLTDIAEDDLTSTGDSVLSIITSSGADRITDADTGAVEGIAVTAVDNTNGQWQYDANADGTWLAFGAVTDTNAALLDTGALIRFVPNADYNGSAGDLTFHAWDQTSGSNGDIGANVSTNGGDTAYSSETFDATLTVTAVNDAPVAVDDSITAIEDTPFTSTIDLDANDTDIDGDALTVVPGTFATTAGGSITIAVDGSYTYTPAANFNGADSVNYTVTDGSLTDVGTLSITVTAVNDAPVAVDDSITAIEDTLFTSTIDLDANDTDIDGDALTVVPGTFATTAGGSITIAADGSYTYTPAANFNGVDSVNYTVTDGALTDVGTLNITVNPVNEAPVAVDDSITAIEDTPFTSTIDLDANDTDIDGDALTVVPGTFATTAGGSITIAADGSYTYTPAANFNGADSVNYTVTDGSLTDVGTLNINVNPVNDAPVAVDDSITATEDTPFTSTVDLDFNDTDLDGDVLSVVPGTFATAAGGSITIAADGSYTYTPAANFNGADSVNYTVTDGSLTDVGTLNITVTAVNDAPVAVDDAIIATEDTPFTSTIDLDANDTDLDGDALTVVPGTFATTAGGSITIAVDGSYTYTPAANFNGADSVNYTVTDGSLTDVGTLSITVTAVNDAPVAVDDSITAIEDTLFTSTIDLDANDTDIDGDALTVVPGTFATTAGGSITIAVDGSYTYTPAANFNGADSVNYTVTDGALTDVGTLNITVTAVNDAPVAVDESITATEDTPFSSTVDLDFNDTDLDGDALTVVPGTFATTAGGSITIAADGSYTYTPAANFNGADSVDYTVTDGSLTDVGTLNITVTAVNDAPVAIDDSITATEDTPFTSTIDLDANDTDIDGDALTVVPGTFATTAGGSITIAADGSYTYTPAANFNGADSVNYTVTDGALTDVGTLNITVNPVNEAPVAVDDSITAIEDTPFTSTIDLDANDTDIDGDALTVVPGTFATTAGGSITIAVDGSYTYTPAANFNGADSVNYTVTDGSLTDVGTLSITVTAVNDAPVAVDDSITAIEDTPFTSTIDLDANDTDIDGDALTVVPGTFATTAGGSITIAADGSYTYTPAANFNGADSVNYTVTDGSLTDVGTLSITVTAVNDAPVAVDDSITAIEDTPFTSTIDLDANDTDIDGDALTVVPGTFATTAGGSITIAADGSYTYTPAANFNGADSVNYTVTDGSLTDVGTLSITVTAVNDAPVAVDDSITAIEDTPFTSTIDLDANDTDIDGDALTVVPGTFATTAGGSITIAVDGSYTYTPAANFNGADSVNYTVTDGALTDVGTLNINVNPVNDAPVAVDDSITATEDTPFTSTVDLDFNDTDLDGDVLSVVPGTFATAAGGSITIAADGSYTYTPAANFNGVDSVNYTVTDGALTDVGTLNITVTAVNDAPVAVDESITATEDTPFSSTVDLDFNDTDLDGDALTVVPGTFATTAGGSITIAADGSYTYTPAANFNGADSVDYTVTDGSLTDVGTLNITVTAVNDAPVAIDDSITATEDTPFTSTIDLDANDTDIDGDALTVVPGTFATTAGGSITIAADGSYTYTPAANFNGADSVNYTVTDGALTDVGTLNITVNPVNEAPVAVDDSITAIEDTPFTSTIDLDANDTDIDGDALTVVPGTFATTAGGSITIAVDGSYTYTPAANFNGADSVNYTVTDGSLTDVGTLSITVTAVNDAPVAVDDSITAIEDTPFTSTIDLDANDTDIDGDALTVVPGTFATTAGGSITIAADGSYTYTPAANFNGADSVNYTVTDGSLTDVGTLNITVTAVNEAPVIGGADRGAVTEDQNVVASKISTSGTLTIADPNAGESSFIGTTVNGALGALTIDTAGNWRYSADNGNPEIQALQSGESITDTLTVTTADGTTHDVVITINGAAEAAPPPPPPVVEPPIVEPPPEAEPPPEEETETGGGVDPIVDDIVRAPQDVTPPPVQEVVDNSGYLQQEQAEADKAETSAVKEKYVAKVIEQPQAQAIQQRNLSLDELSLQVSDDAALNEKFELELLSRIDSMHSGMDGEAAQTSADDVEVQIVMGSTASLTAGIVSWVLRGGSLLASFMSTVPLLNRFDPLPILKSREEKEDVEEDTDDDDADTKFKKHQKRVDNLFSGKDAARDRNEYMNE